MIHVKRNGKSCVSGADKRQKNTLQGKNNPCIYSTTSWQIILSTSEKSSFPDMESVKIPVTGITKAKSLIGFYKRVSYIETPLFLSEGKYWQTTHIFIPQSLNQHSDESKSLSWNTFTVQQRAEQRSPIKHWSKLAWLMARAHQDTKTRARAVLSYECGGGFSPEAPGIITTSSAGSSSVHWTHLIPATVYASPVKMYTLRLRPSTAID